MADTDRNTEFQNLTVTDSLTDPGGTTHTESIGGGGSSGLALENTDGTTLLTTSTVQAGTGLVFSDDGDDTATLDVDNTVAQTDTAETISGYWTFDSGMWLSSGNSIDSGGGTINFQSDAFVMSTSGSGTGTLVFYDNDAGQNFFSATEGGTVSFSTETEHGVITATGDVNASNLASQSGSYVDVNLEAGETFGVYSRGDAADLARLPNDTGVLTLSKGGVEFPPRASAPASPSNGQTEYADGTNWDPGSGAGLYCYEEGAWTKL